MEVINDTPTTDATTEVPVLYAGKYSTVEDLTTGYENLQSSYSTKTAEYNTKMKGFSGAPEEYTLGDDVQGNDTISAWGLENGLSNDAYGSLVGKMNDASRAKADAFREAEIGKLGSNAQERIANLIDVAKAQGIDVEVLDNMTQTASGVEVLEKLFKETVGGNPVNVASRAVSGDALKAMRFEKDEFGRRRMHSDVAFAKRVQQLELEAFNRR